MDNEAVDFILFPKSVCNINHVSLHKQPFFKQ